MGSDNTLKALYNPRIEEALSCPFRAPWVAASYLGRCPRLSLFRPFGTDVVVAVVVFGAVPQARPCPERVATATTGFPSGLPSAVRRWSTDW